ncbi:RNA polymerase, sigma-24 subunit, ECF subfamily [Catenulispora acidiphila DSM 44928]|uniref:RNA polymerase, sigma-24 subunit, ECF subfamily n=1 Tax=Catenulispora acidiphila (strain DSM 44928 / JCM 14897 / NBRC 102108 / NRRL B-24433 / ID139908) TaxID=479433 RepID=C7QFP6_CATAD|nr:SigE family RNA polymerase sigma factor [Catenulispora acidiphila]ACU68985.1 RNA polymerase, sigma-24 subunit, ECF subfamily [Catenulispora acidiphila DSM 44928]
MRPEDEDEFRRFTAARWPGLVRTAYLLTGDLGHAEDLAQTTLIKAYRSWHRVCRVEDVDAYVRKILINANRSRFRSKRPLEYSVAAVPEYPAWPPDDGSGVEERTVLFAALATLPPRQRAIVVLRYWEDLAEGEVAALVGCSVGTVKSQASRALAKLRKDARLAGLSAFQEPAAAMKGAQT